MQTKTLKALQFDPIYDRNNPTHICNCFYIYNMGL